MPCILRSAHRSSYCSKQHQSNTSTLTARDVQDRGARTAVIIVLIVVGAVLGFAILLFRIWRWAKRSHMKAYLKAGGTANQVRHRGRSNVRGRLQADEAKCPKAYNLEQGHLPFDDVRQMDGFPVPKVPPPSYRSKPDAVLPVLRHGLGQLGHDGRMHRAQSIRDYVQDVNDNDSVDKVDSRRCGAPSAKIKFRGTWGNDLCIRLKNCG